VAPNVDESAYASATEVGTTTAAPPSASFLSSAGLPTLVTRGHEGASSATRPARLICGLYCEQVIGCPASAQSIHPSARRNGRKRGWVLVRYCGPHEKEASGRPLRRAVVLHRAPPSLPTPRVSERPGVHHTLREILDAVFYVVRSGCAWRLLPHESLLGIPTATTSGLGASIAPGQGCPLPCASERESARVESSAHGRRSR
jgi:Putative transposase of IS4/5 family (DUF4096)